MGGLSHTVSGDIASFRTPSRVPIESLKFHFLPKQAAGTPTPENPLPIEGWTGLNGERSGKNLLDTSTKATADHYELNGITFDYNSDGSLTVNGKVSDSATTGPQYKLAVWTQKVTGNYYICANAPYSGTYNEIYVYDSDLSERPKKWDGVTASQSASSGRPLSEVRLLAGHNYSFNVRINRGTDKQYNNDKFYPMLLPAWCTDTTFELYSGELIPITFPDGETIYGGYYDPVAGEIVCDWFKYKCTGNESLTKWYLYGSTNNIAARIPFSICGGRYEDGAFNAKCNLEESISNIQMYYGYRTHGICISNGGYVTIQVDGITTLNDMSEWLAENKPEIVFKANNPIHIPIPAEDMTAFLDHNNFWSDANDITEVTYAVAESKDILATRKKAMDFDHAHHKKVKWNNMAGAMNDQYWVRYNPNMIDVDFENNEALITVKSTSSMPFSVSIRTNGDPTVYSNHRYYVSYCLYPYFDNAYFGAEFGNNVYTGYFYFEKDKWSRFSYRSKAGGDGMGRMYIPYFKPGSYAIGDSVRIKNAYYIDLTLMFGEGNEPTTAEEFEHICEINGIDLTTYQPYDEGSDRWLIIP